MARTPRNTNTETAIVPIREKLNRTQLMDLLSEKANVERVIVRDILKALADVALASLSPRGSGDFTLPGVVKLGVRKIPARKGGKTVNNPFKPGETMITKDRPALNRVKARVLAGIKEAANPGAADRKRAAREAATTRRSSRKTRGVAPVEAPAPARQRRAAPVQVEAPTRTRRTSVAAPVESPARQRRAAPAPVEAPARTPRATRAQAPAAKAPARAPVRASVAKAPAARVRGERRGERAENIREF